VLQFIATGAVFSGSGASATVTDTLATAFCHIESLISYSALISPEKPGVGVNTIF